MAVYKQVRKMWLNQLTKEQKKQFKKYIQDVSDAMLEAYAETIRLTTLAYKEEYNSFPIDVTNVDLQVAIKLHHRKHETD